MNYFSFSSQSSFFIDHSHQISHHSNSSARSSHCDDFHSNFVSHPNKYVASDYPGSIVNQQISSLSSTDCLFHNDRVTLSLKDETASVQIADISTDYNSDDGWSDDSTELLYVDDRYVI